MTVLAGHQRGPVEAEMRWGDARQTEDTTGAEALLGKILRVRKEKGGLCGVSRVGGPLRSLDLILDMIER